MTHQFLILLWSALMMGLLGGAHCIGMCGGIVCALSYSCQRGTSNQWFSFGLQIAYSLGRICTYTLLGAATGLLGYVLAERTGTQGAFYIRLFSAFLIILAGFYVAGWWQWVAPLERAGKRLWLPVSKLTRNFLPVTTVTKAFLLGGVWGLLPCGMVYSALLFSLGTESVMASMTIMFAFGLGTLPALLLAGTVMQSYQRYLASFWVRQISGVTLLLLGGVMIWFITDTYLHQTMSCH